MNKEKIKEKINSIIEEAFDQKKYFESLNNKDFRRLSNFKNLIFRILNSYPYIN